MYDQRANILKNIKSKADVDIAILRETNSKAVEKSYQALNKVELRKRQSTLAEDVIISPTRLKNSSSPPST